MLGLQLAAGQYAHEPQPLSWSRARPDRNADEKSAVSGRLGQKLDRDYEDKWFILLRDSNDNPDDKSLNILETGDIDAQGGAEENDGALAIQQSIWLRWIRSRTANRPPT